MSMISLGRGDGTATKQLRYFAVHGDSVEHLLLRSSPAVYLTADSISFSANKGDNCKIQPAVYLPFTQSLQVQHGPKP
jgi:hypothetical protein